MPGKRVWKKITTCLFLSQKLYYQTALVVFIEDAAKHQLIVMELRTNT